MKTKIYTGTDLLRTTNKEIFGVQAEFNDALIDIIASLWDEIDTLKKDVARLNKESDITFNDLIRKENVYGRR